MANTLSSPNMNLPVPIVGTEAGPQYAIDINSCMAVLDGHNHTTGYGVPVPTAGLNINADLTFNGVNATNLRTLRLSPQATQPGAGTDIGCLYEYGVDLYYNDGSGNKIRITQSGSVTGSSGTITGLPSGTASANYSSGTFTFDSATNTPANIQGASLLMGNNAANSFYLTLSPPSSMAANTTITLPTLPASPAPMVIDNSGNITASPALYAAFNPTGALIAFAGSSAPTGYLLCNGSAVSRTTYANLYGVIGTTYGVGDGSTTFNIPNTGGMFLRGAGSQVVGSKTYTATLGQVLNDTTAVNGMYDAGHNHTLDLWGNGGTSSPPYHPTYISPFGGFVQSTTDVLTGAANLASSQFETTPANLGMNYIIKT